MYYKVEGKELSLVRRAAAIAVSLVGLAVIFQLFFRYQYVASGAYVFRVDRLTLATCYMPCRPAVTYPPSSSPTANPTLPPGANPFLEGVTPTPKPSGNPLLEGITP